MKEIISLPNPQNRISKCPIIPLGNSKALITVLVLLQFMVISATPCKQIGRDGSFLCIVCQLEGKLSYCALDISLHHSVKFDYYQCLLLRQEYKATSLCSKNNRNLSLNETNSEKNIDPKIFIIIFSTVPFFICLCCIFTRVIKQRCQTPIEQVVLPETAINLQLFDIDKLWPYCLDLDRTCPICYDSKCNIVTKCGHYYHLQCLEAWINKRFVCPLCVSNKLNPIAAYCSKCNKSVELRLIHRISYRDMEGKQEIQCKRCISITSSNSEIQIKAEQIQ